MNNSIQLEDEPEIIEERTELLREREGVLVQVIEAFGYILESKEWSTLETHVFDGVLESLQKRMASESYKLPLDEKEIYKLQGQIAWAKKYSNLEDLANVFRLELTNIRNQLKPPGSNGIRLE